jgi:hypothetical protein
MRTESAIHRRVGFHIYYIVLVDLLEEVSLDSKETSVLHKTQWIKLASSVASLKAALESMGDKAKQSS